MEENYYRKPRSRFNPGNWIRSLKGSRRRLIGLVAVLVVAWLALFSNYGIVQRIRLERQRAALQEKIRMAERENQRKQEELKALEHDRKVIEKVARERYGMVRNGEKVYKTGTPP